MPSLRDGNDMIVYDLPPIGEDKKGEMRFYITFPTSSAPDGTLLGLATNLLILIFD
jgi:hypothetical protein